MKNYESQLLSIQPDQMADPRPHLAEAEVAQLQAVHNSQSYGAALRSSAEQLPFEISAWPSFGTYADDWFQVKVTSTQYQLLYGERGNSHVRKRCKNGIELAYEILSVGLPIYTEAAQKIAGNLDRIKDQRLLIWLRMSSAIYYAFQVNDAFGMQKATANMTWMCEELVRMGVFDNRSAAFNSQPHMLQGLMASGLSKVFATNLLKSIRQTRAKIGPVDAAVMREIEEMAEIGRNIIPSTNNEESAEIVAKINQFVIDAKAQSRQLTKDQTLALGILLGWQYVNGLDWHWGEVTWNADQPTPVIGVLSPDNSLFNNPMAWVNNVLTTDQAVNFMLNYNMVAAGKTPKGHPDQATSFQ